MSCWLIVLGVGLCVLRPHYWGLGMLIFLLGLAGVINYIPQMELWYDGQERPEL